jgi:hypothetical protein
MREASVMCPPETCSDTPSVTSLQESEVVATPFDSPDGQTTNPYGRVLAHASLSARQAREKGLLTSGTFGQTGSGSSDTGDLTSCLGNRLKVQLDGLGSTLFSLTWKEAVTPAGRRYSLLRASGHRTDGTGLTGWVTPRANGDAGGVRWLVKCYHLEDQVRTQLIRLGLTVSEAKAARVSSNFTRRLMGYPPAWNACADTVTRSSRK